MCSRLPRTLLRLTTEDGMPMLHEAESRDMGHLLEPAIPEIEAAVNVNVADVTFQPDSERLRLQRRPSAEFCSQASHPCQSGPCAAARHL